ncbi:MAG TPA: hypothetical protein VEB22_04780 [Phycisphaerales bacterium]|nr:hypothetical protein [Phycisphaerales bacterium]
MNPVHRFLLALLTAAAVGVVAWRVVAWRSAAAEFDSAYTDHSDVNEKAARAAALRALPPVSGYGSRPTDDVIQLSNRVLEAANLPVARLRGVQPEGDRAASATDDRDGRRIAAVRLSLEPLTVQELGAFLAAWRSRQQVWSVARVELNAPASGGRAAGQYRATITVSASYIDDPATKPAGAAQ